MKRVIVLLALLSSSPALAQGTPHKLIILWRESIAVVDYPSLARCKAALVELERRKQSEEATRQPRSTPGGGVIVPAPWAMDMACIPG